MANQDPLYYEETRELTRARGKIACLFGITLVPLFSILDYFFVPNLWPLFLLLRVANTAENGVIYSLLHFRKTLSVRQLNLLSSLYFCSIGIMIAYMCRLMGGYQSTYYAGINLVMLAVSLLMPWHFFYTLLNGLIMFSAYAILGFTESRVLTDFLNNSYFLFSTILVASVASYWTGALRKKEYRARQELKELDKAKSRFFSNVTHEFRTPLVTFSSTIQLLLDGGLQDPVVQRKLLSGSKDSLDDMLENVNDLLMKSRSEKGLVEMKWSEIAIGEFVEKALKGFETMAQKRGNRLVFNNKLEESHPPLNPLPSREGGIPLKIYADRSKLKKIINNLVGNALKFTENGTVEVILNKTDTHCVLEVKDTGPGIPKEDLLTIFDPFTQASNNPLRDVHGTGLGLSMVKEFVDLHQGKVAVESKIGQGSLFTVSLPLGDAHVDMEKLDTSEIVDEESCEVINFKIKSFDDIDLTPFEHHDPAKENILLVEDDPQVIQVLAHVLKDHYNLYFAKDGQEGLDKIREHKPDLVISDIMMPRMNGYELVRAIKQHPDLQFIPIIVLTSKADKESKIKGHEEGADEYLSKPFNNKEILTRIRGLLDRSKLEIELVHEQKMDGLGHLAAGIAHEINNPASFARNALDGLDEIYAALEVGKISLKEARDLTLDNVKLAKRGLTRVCEIASALKGYVGRTGGFVPDDIREGIESTLLIFHTDKKANIQFHKQYELEDKVICNMSNLKQVFLNLLTNAAQSLNGTENGEIWIHTYRDKLFAYVTIRDNGYGVPKEIQRRIFHPYFTTKNSGEKGTGIGLYVSDRIIREHGGTITFESEEGKGTKFMIQLPIEGGGRNDQRKFTKPSIDQRLYEVQYPYRRR